jgi:hypothetical protein
MKGLPWSTGMVDMGTAKAVANSARVTASLSIILNVFLDLQMCDSVYLWPMEVMCWANPLAECICMFAERQLHQLPTQARRGSRGGEAQRTRVCKARAAAVERSSRPKADHAALWLPCDMCPASAGKGAQQHFFPVVRTAHIGLKKIEQTISFPSFANLFL